MQEGYSTWFVCVCVCVCVCLSVETIFAIVHNTIRISALWERFLKSYFYKKCFVPKLRLFLVYTVPMVGHFLTSVSMCKGLCDHFSESNIKTAIIVKEYILNATLNMSSVCLLYGWASSSYILSLDKRWGSCIVLINVPRVLHFSAFILLRTSSTGYISGISSWNLVLLTIGVHAQEGYYSWVCPSVCMCVCVC